MILLALIQAAAPAETPMLVSLGEKALTTAVGALVGGTFVSWKIGGRMTKVEHELWGPNGDNGVKSRVSNAETKLADIARTQDRHTILLDAVKDSLEEIKGLFRLVLNTPPGRA